VAGGFAVKVKVTEAEFTKTVIAFAKLRGWRVLHIRPGRTSKGWRTPVQGDGVGFPDLLLLKGERIVVIELKVGKNRATPEQSAWLDAFHAAGAVARVFHPDDWERIEALLT
jgi:hypothetical protein